MIGENNSILSISSLRHGAYHECKHRGWLGRFPLPVHFSLDFPALLNSWIWFLEGKRKGWLAALEIEPGKMLHSWKAYAYFIGLSEEWRGTLCQRAQHTMRTWSKFVHSYLQLDAQKHHPSSSGFITKFVTNFPCYAFGLHGALQACCSSLGGIMSPSL